MFYWIFLLDSCSTCVRGLSGAGAPSATARPGGLRDLPERCVKLFYTTIKIDLVAVSLTPVTEAAANWQHSDPTPEQAGQMPYRLSLLQREI